MKTFVKAAAGVSVAVLAVYCIKKMIGRKNGRI